MSNDEAQSDLVRLALDIPYMSPEMRDEFEFSLEGYSRVLKYMPKNNLDDSSIVKFIDKRQEMPANYSSNPANNYSNILNHSL